MRSQAGAWDRGARGVDARRGAWGRVESTLRFWSPMGLGDLHLPLGELDAAAGAAEAVLFAFLHARIAGEIAAAAEGVEGFAVEGDEGAGDAHLAGAGLAVGAAAACR